MHLHQKLHMSFDKVTRTHKAKYYLHPCTRVFFFFNKAVYNMSEITMKYGERIRLMCQVHTHSKKSCLYELGMEKSGESPQ